MTGEDIARVIVYSSLAIPAVCFVLTYSWLLLRHLRITEEAVHLLSFTAVIAYIAIDFLVAIALEWWGFSVSRFLIVMGLASIMLWHRYYLLLKYSALPRLRAERKKRRLQKRKTPKPVH